VARREREIAPFVWEVEEDPPPPRLQPPEWRFKCPKCQAPKGQTCVYVSGAWRWETRFTGIYRKPVHVQLHAAGEPTKRSHAERLWLLTPRKEPVTEVARWSPVVRSWWEADAREHAALREWLRANASLFQRREGDG
jgi:hypothetical protein